MQLTGSIPAIVTPMRNDVIDLAAFERIVGELSESCSAIVVAGSTGEGTSLSQDEKTGLLDSASKAVKIGTRVIAGIAAATTRDAQAAAQESEEAGADALLVSTPFYVKASEDGIILHYKELARTTSAPIILYNIPSRTGCNLSKAAILELWKDGAICGLKEAAENQSRVQEIVVEAGPQFQVLCGDDVASFGMLSSGAKGTISVVANIFPKQVALAHELFFTLPQADLSHAVFELLEPLVAHLAKIPNPLGVKHALAYLNQCSNDCRLPLTQVDIAAAREIEEAIRTIQSQI